MSEYGPTVTVKIGANAWLDAADTWGTTKETLAAGDVIHERRRAGCFVIELPLSLAEDLLDHCDYTAYWTDAERSIKDMYRRAAETIRLQLFEQTGKPYCRRRIPA